MTYSLTYEYVESNGLAIMKSLRLQNSGVLCFDDYTQLGEKWVNGTLQYTVSWSV